MFGDSHSVPKSTQRNHAQHERDQKMGERVLPGGRKRALSKRGAPASRAALTHSHSGRDRARCRWLPQQQHLVLHLVCQRTIMPEIVCTPADAYRCFMRTEMDVLVLEDCVLEKANQPEFEDGSNWQSEFELD